MNNMFKKEFIIIIILIIIIFLINIFQTFNDISKENKYIFSLPHCPISGPMTWDQKPCKK